MNSYKEIYKSSIDWSNVFKRTTKNPLDRSSMFNSYDDALLYAKGEGDDSRGIGGTSYVGQIISVFENGNVSVFKIIGKDGYDENGKVIVKERGLEELISKEEIDILLDSYSKTVDLETTEKEINNKIDNLQSNIEDTYVTNGELTEVKETINNLSSDTNSYFVKIETLDDVQNNFNKQIEIINDQFVKNETLDGVKENINKELLNLSNRLDNDFVLKTELNDYKDIVKNDIDDLKDNVNSNFVKIETLDDVKENTNKELLNLSNRLDDDFVLKTELEGVKENIDEEVLNLSNRLDNDFVLKTELNDVKENTNNELLNLSNRLDNGFDKIETLNENLINLDSKIITNDALSEIINDNKFNFNVSRTISPYTTDNKNFTFNVKLTNDEGNILLKKEDGLYSHVDVSIDDNKLIFNSNGDIKEYDIYKNVKLSNDVENILVKNEDGLFVRKPNETQILNTKDSVIELGFSNNEQTDINYISSDVKLYNDLTNLIVKKRNSDGKNTLYVSNDASKYVIGWRRPDNSEYITNVKDVLYLLKSEIDNFNGNIDLEYYD